MQQRIVEWGAACDKINSVREVVGTGALRPDFPIFLARGSGGTIEQENAFFDRCMRQNKPALPRWGGYVWL